MKNKTKKTTVFCFCFIEVINNHEALSNTCGPEEVLLLRSGALGQVTMATVCLLWPRWVQSVRKTLTIKGGHVERERRDKEVSEWGGRRGGGGSLPCQLGFQRLQQADLSGADAFALTRGGGYLRVTPLWFLMENVGRWISQFQDMWKEDKKLIEEGREKVSAFMPSRGYFAKFYLVLAVGRMFFFSGMQQRYELTWLGFKPDGFRLD